MCARFASIILGRVTACRVGSVVQYRPSGTTRRRCGLCRADVRVIEDEPEPEPEPEPEEPELGAGLESSAAAHQQQQQSALEPLQLRSQGCTAR
jgi:hypothetical protein